LPATQTVKNLLCICLLLLLAACGSKTEKKTNVTVNGKAYSDSVVVDSAGNRVEVSGDGKVTVSGSGNTVEIK
jgi:ABC-type Fe3+-hydroxamate transport system substrate-binding protein